MRPSGILRLSTLALIVAATGVAPAQKKAVKKPPVRAVAGTAQLPGDNGKLKQAYTMGKAEKLNLVLTGVRYTKTRWSYGNETIAPNQGQKLMVLTFSVQNPNPSGTHIDSGAMRFTAVDNQGVNHEGVPGLIQTNGRTTVDFDLKPAQRIECETVILVPAMGAIPKLMVAHRTGGSVLRYDLHDVVTPLAKPFSTNGVDAPSVVPGEAGVAYPLLGTDVTIGATEFKTGAFGDLTEREGSVFMTTKLTLVARTPGKLAFQIHGEAVDADGEKYPSIDLRKASSEAEGGGIGEAGEPLSCRMLFQVPKGVKIVKVRVWEGSDEQRSTAIEVPVGLTAG